MSEKKSEWIIDATDDTFQKDVVERSKSKLCIVDFWAEWCGPCRMLGPVLEELAEEFQGKFYLVKIDTDAAQKTAAEFGISSIPAVFAFVDGDAVDGFAGVMPKEQIKQWIDGQLEAGEIDSVIAMVQTDPESALVKLKEYFEENPEEPAIQIAMAEAHLSLNQEAEAREIILQMEDRGYLEPEAEKIKAKMDLKSKEGLDVDASRAKAESEPDNLEFQLEYANALFGHDQYEQGLEICLEVVQKEKTGVGDKARELMLEVFRSLPEGSELTIKYQRKLSMALY